jgi:hypothetical protein
MLPRSLPGPHAPPRSPGDVIASVATVPRPPRRALPRTPLPERLRAAGLHLVLSAVVCAGVLSLALFAWYPGPLAALLGVDAILPIVLGVDLVLGPLCTLLVFDRRKPRLALDLATIVAVQLAALGYGLHAIQEGRPAFVVLARDRFEVVAPAELDAAAREAAAGNPLAVMDPWRPRWVAARLPTERAERERMLFESLATGRDVQHHPRLYVTLADETPAALARALPIGRLRELNPGLRADVDAAVAATGRPEAALRYLPLRAPAADGAVLLGHPDGTVLGVARLVPW